MHYDPEYVPEQCCIEALVADPCQCNPGNTQVTSARSSIMAMKEDNNPRSRFKTDKAGNKNCGSTEFNGTLWYSVSLSA